MAVKSKEEQLLFVKTRVCQSSLDSMIEEEVGLPVLDIGVGIEAEEETAHRIAAVMKETEIVTTEDQVHPQDIATKELIVMRTIEKVAKYQ